MRNVFPQKKGAVERNADRGRRILGGMFRMIPSFVSCEIRKVPGGGRVRMVDRPGRIDDWCERRISSGNTGRRRESENAGGEACEETAEVFDGYVLEIRVECGIGCCGRLGIHGEHPNLCIRRGR
jgi:hypothetical protein